MNNDPITVSTPSGNLTLDPSYISRAKDWEEFVSLWTIAQDIDRSNQWYKGDIANKVSIVHGESSLKKFAEEVREKEKTLIAYRRVARAYPDPSMRNLNLSWTHYLIASLSDAVDRTTNQFITSNRFKWLEEAHDNGWTVSRLGMEIKKQTHINSQGDYFTWYKSYLEKVRNVITHAEKDKLSEFEKDELIKHLLDTYNQFQVYLKDKS